MKKVANFLFNSTFGLFIIINVMFIGGLLAATGVAIGAALWFGLNVFVGFTAMQRDKAQVPTNSYDYIHGGGGTVQEDDSNKVDTHEQQST